MLGFLYFGRLEKEKWFDAIIDMISMFGKVRHNKNSNPNEGFSDVELIPAIWDDIISSGAKKLNTSQTDRWKNNEELPFQLFVFGSWTYEKEIMQLAHKYKTIHFFWRQARETIRRYVSNCNFVLAPTTCLETFGLVALSGMERGIPTIGFAKWWATPFIDPALDLTNVEGESLSEKLYHLITRLGKEEFFTNSLPIAEILEHHSIENWKASIAYLLWNKKKILIVSDFTNKIGGLETYINDTKDILNNMEYEAELFGTKIRTGPLGRLIKYIWMFGAIFNFRTSIQLRIKIKRMKPDLIRYNSVMRYIGRLPLRTMRKAKAEKRMMYHDLGYFYPFPSKLEREDQIKTPFTFRNFVSSAPSHNPIKKFFIALKYFSLKLIKRQLKKSMDLHIVPSAFMRPILEKSYRIDDEKITVLSHFIQE